MALMLRSATGAPGGGAYPSYASDSTSGFIPQVWSSLLTEQFWPNTVIGDIANTNWEGEIKGYGDSVVIRVAPYITVTDHTVGADIWDDYEVPEGENVILEINKAKKFAVQLDDIDILQSDLDLQGEFTQNAGHSMATEIDRAILVDIQDDADAANKGATAGAISGAFNMGTPGAPRVLNSTNIVRFILECGVVLDEQNVPRDMGSRFIVLPQTMIMELKDSEIKRVDVTGDSESTLRNGKVGRIDDMTIYSSNLLPKTGAVTSVFAGHKSALTFASQVDPHTLDYIPNPRKFGKLMRGMAVYGNQTVKPDAMVNAYVSL